MATTSSSSSASFPSANPALRTESPSTATVTETATPPVESAQPQTAEQQIDPPAKSPGKRTKSPGVRVVGQKVYDSENGKTCHQCRQKTLVLSVSCTNVKENQKKCTLQVCQRCLSNRYGENAEEAAALGDWKCPKCRNICNCSFCMKKKGCKPTGILARTAKARGFSSVSSLLNVDGVTLEQGETSKKQDASIQDAKGESSRKRQKRSIDGESQDDNDMIGERSRDDTAQTQLPNGTELLRLGDIDIPSGDIGHVLQLSEYYETFAKFHGMKKGESETLIRELASEIPSGRNEQLIVQFHIKLLSLIEEDAGRSLSQKLWVEVLLKLVSEFQYPAKAGLLDCVNLEADAYKVLSFSKKLRILNFLCDEALNTEKLRSWILGQNSEDMTKEKEERLAKREKMRHMKLKKQQLRDEEEKAILARDGRPLSIQEHQDLVSKVESETAEPLAQKEEAEDKQQQRAHALRSKPVCTDANGRKFWRLRSCSDKLDILLQDISCGDAVDFDEKWFTYNAQDKALIEQYVSSNLSCRRVRSVRR